MINYPSYACKSIKCHGEILCFISNIQSLMIVVFLLLRRAYKKKIHSFKLLHFVNLDIPNGYIQIIALSNISPIQTSMGGAVKTIMSILSLTQTMGIEGNKYLA